MQNDPLQLLFEQFAALLKQMEDNASKPLQGPVDPSIYKKLDRLADAVHDFRDRFEKRMRERV